LTPIDPPEGAILNIPELNSSNTASPMVQDAPIIDPELESAHYQSSGLLSNVYFKFLWLIATFRAFERALESSLLCFTVSTNSKLD
jgi:hypothetical protein